MINLVFITQTLIMKFKNLKLSKFMIESSKLDQEASSEIAEDQLMEELGQV